jgi:hypothetical protein
MRWEMHCWILLSLNLKSSARSSSPNCSNLVHFALEAELNSFIRMHVRSTFHHSLCLRKSPVSLHLEPDGLAKRAVVAGSN